MTVIRLAIFDVLAYERPHVNVYWVFFASFNLLRKEVPFVCFKVFNHISYQTL